MTFFNYCELADAQQLLQDMVGDEVLNHLVAHKLINYMCGGTTTPSPTNQYLLPHTILWATNAHTCMQQLKVDNSTIANED